MNAPLDLETTFNVRRRGILALTLLVSFAGFAGAITFPALIGAVGSALGAAGFVCSIALILGWLVFVGNLNKRRPGNVRIDTVGVHLGERLLPRERIRSAYFAPAAGSLEPNVRLLGERDRVLASIGVRDHEQANQVLDAIGVGAKQRTARFSATSPNYSASWFAGVGGVLAGMALMALAIPLQPGAMLLSLLVIVAATALFLACKVHVGADGLLLATRISPRFLPWSAVIAVEPSKTGIVIRTKSETIRVPMSGGRKRHHENNIVLKKALVARANDALDAYRRGEHTEVAARVARGGRSDAEWLRALADREGDYRTSPLLDDQLWTVVESATAEASARAGAAVVLARQAGDAERTRFRIAADACTAPQLRVVLEKAASGASEAEVTEALSEIDDVASSLRHARH